MTIGVFGGTFNPPHMGHLITLESVVDQIHCDRLLFVPSSTPPHKTDSSVASAEARLAMTALAVEGHPLFEASDIEVRRPGTSYTVDTLIGLQQLYTRASLLLIIGADNFVELETWRAPEEIFARAEVIVMSRPGFTNVSVRSDYQRRARFVHVPLIGISGTEIRRRIKQGRSIRYLVPQKVEEYIRDHHLYVG